MSAVNVDWKKKITLNLTDANTPHDRILIVGKQKFYVQSQCLSLWSEFFAGLFNNEFKESQMVAIPIKGVKATDFNTFLLAIYPTRQKITVGNLAAMIDLSFRFLAPGVLDMCREVIDKKFDELDKIGLLEVSFRCEFDNIKLEIDGTAASCNHCKKTTHSLNKKQNDYHCKDYCSNCNQYSGQKGAQVAKFICIDSCEYFRENKKD